ncbi:MAG: hypothetical protein J4N70_04765 [Chloroflexi bacterium]|nr:hypothetical protein [Chloroflexota bacterium]
MKRLGAVLVFMILLALACGETATPHTPLSPALEATAQAVVSETESASQTTAGTDAEATITARVQATVQALISATPIPSPTPTLSVSVPTPEPTSFTTMIGGPFNTAPAPTATQIPAPAPSHTTQPTLLPTRLAGCSAAADGVEVSAWINGDLAATATVESGSYLLLVEQLSGYSFGGQTINFTVAGHEAGQSLVWTQGGATELNLTARGGGSGRLAPADVGGPYLGGGPLAQPLLPHVILGTVFVGDC